MSVESKKDSRLKFTKKNLVRVGLGGAAAAGALIGVAKTLESQVSAEELTTDSLGAAEVFDASGRPDLIPERYPTLTSVASQERQEEIIEKAWEASEASESLETAGEILAFIQEKYGVEIPNEVSRTYSEETYFRNAEGEREVLETKPNALLTYEEAKVVEKALAKIPGADHLAQLIFFYKIDDSKVIPGGSFLGYQWPAFLRMADFDVFPYDQFVSEIAAIKINLQEGANMDSPLPPILEESVLLPPLVQMLVDQAGVEPNLKVEYSWTTHGDMLEQALVHEFGHGLLDSVLLAGSANIEEYWQRQRYTLLGMGTTDINHPLFATFAKVNGWELVSSIEHTRRIDPELAEKWAKDYQDWGEDLVWDRDPAIWGSLENRNSRIDPYATYGPLHETFSQFWMASILYPELLTPTEKEYFKRIQDGLREDPEAFIQQLAADSSFLLEGLESIEE